MGGLAGGSGGCSTGGGFSGQMPTGGVGGLGNLGLPDSEYLNPILDQRIDFLKRMIARMKPKPVRKPAAAEEAPAEE